MSLLLFSRRSLLKNVHFICSRKFSVEQSREDLTKYWEDKLTALKQQKHGDKLTAAELYNEWAEDYEETIGNIGWDAPEQCVEYFLKNNTNVNRPKILDIGCGPGLVGKNLKKNCKYDFELHGCDIAPNMIKKAKKLNIYSVIQEMDFNQFPYNIHETDSFDAVICSGALSYCNDIGSFLNECLRVSRYKAMIVISHREDHMKQHSHFFTD
eukprot:UN03771